MDRREAVPHEHRSIELERLVLFSDAVFAIAITLLVLELKVPDRESIRSAGGVAAALFGELPKFAAFFISFAVIGFYWIAHHRMSRHIRRCNGTLLALNLLLLLFVAFLPFPVALFGSFRREPTAIAFYAISMPLAFAHANWAMFSWLLVVPLLRIVGGRLAREANEAERRSRESGHSAVPAVVPAHALAPSPANPSPRASEPGPQPPVDPAPGP